MRRTFAIGDIHGCSDSFHQMLFKEIKIKKSDKIYCIGDYIDRGPDSKGVVDIILSLRHKGYSIHTLRGNHEQMMMESVKSKIQYVHWVNNGGGATLKSFNCDEYSAFPNKYKQFFTRTKYYIRTSKYIFVHAGLDFSIPNPFIDKKAMLWIRNFAPLQVVLQNKKLIHGHTPKPLSDILKQEGNCINIDGGCVYNKNEDLGNLIGLSLPENQFRVVENK